MAVIRGTLGGAVVLALAAGIPIGCGSGTCATSCAAGGRGIDVTVQGDATRFELCVDETCYELANDPSMDIRWSNADVQLPSGEARYRVTVFGSGDSKIATFDETLTAPSDECCGAYLPLEFDGEVVKWVD